MKATVAHADCRLSLVMLIADCQYSHRALGEQEPLIDRPPATRVSPGDTCIAKQHMDTYEYTLVAGTVA